VVSKEAAENSAMLEIFRQKGIKILFLNKYNH
jgi:hypothetical protein